MNKLFTMARQGGKRLMMGIAALLAMDAVSRPISTILPSQHWPMPDHRNGTAAADKRCARRRSNIAKRRG